MRQSNAALATKIDRSKVVITTSIALLLTCLLMAKSGFSQSSQLQPSPELSPQQVINIVVESLQTNQADDAGIATVFRFASPSNKAYTGPFPRFVNMIKRGFPDMLNHIAVRYDDMEIVGNTAVQAVWLRTETGAEYGYAFQLRKQRLGEVDGVWMTDGVVPLGKSAQSGIGI